MFQDEAFKNSFKCTENCRCLISFVQFNSLVVYFVLVWFVACYEIKLSMVVCFGYKAIKQCDELRVCFLLALQCYNSSSIYSAIMFIFGLAVNCLLVVCLLVFCYLFAFYHSLTVVAFFHLQVCCCTSAWLWSSVCRVSPLWLGLWTYAISSLD